MQPQLPWLTEALIFPKIQPIKGLPSGLIAAGGDLSVARLIAAYQRGIFPWYNPGEPILWWSPEPRMVLMPNAFKRSRSLKKTVRQRVFDVQVDTVFTEVVRGCAGPRDGCSGSWIQEEMVQAYTRMFECGYAHSIESWQQDCLMGGLYGVRIGAAFFGESMFSLKTDASKVALSYLCEEGAKRGLQFIDCQMQTDHLSSLGAKPLSRQEFQQLLVAAVSAPLAPGRWLNIRP